MTQKPLMLTLNDAIADAIDILTTTGKFGNTHRESIGKTIENFLFALEKLERLRNRKGRK